MAKFHTAGQLSQFILHNAGHDGQPQFAVLIQGVDIVALEEYAHTGRQKFLDVLDGIQHITGKPGNLLGIACGK